MKELLDIFDENMNHIGVADRKEIHKEGLWHQTFHCWIIMEYEGKKHLLFQIRHQDKDIFPNLLDITAAGHLAAGEKPLDGIRELEEELGITVATNELVSIGTIKEQLSGKTFIDNELCHVYLHKSNKPLSEYHVQEEEVIGLVIVPIEEAVAFFSNQTNSLTLNGIKQYDSKHEAVTFTVNKEAFVPHNQSYYLYVFEKALQL